MNLSHFQFTPLPAHRQQLVDLMKPFTTLRFMDWQRINGSTVNCIAELPTVIQNAIGNWSRFQGVPLNECIKFANDCDSRGWYCIPHRASDETLSYIVEMVLTQSVHKPVFEFSNELWNGIFAQSIELQRFGGVAYQIDQTKKIKSMVGDCADVVICGQFWFPESVINLSKMLNNQSILVGVAPYLGASLRASDYPTVEVIHSTLKVQLSAMRINIKSLIDAVGVGRLVAYEGGLHLVARRDGISDERRIFYDYNKSIEAGEISASLWESWIELGGGIACPYSSATIYRNQWTGDIGNDFYGHCEVSGETIVPTEKYRRVKQLLMKRNF